MIVAVDPTGNLTSPNFNCRCTVVNNTLVPLAASDWNVLQALKNWDNGQKNTPPTPNPPVPNNSVVSIQPGNIVQCRPQGTAAQFETWQFNGSIAAISPNLSGQFGSDVSVITWAYQVIG